MKKAKKLVSLLLAVVMLLSLAVSVGAAAGTPDPAAEAVVVDAKNTKSVTSTEMEGVESLGSGSITIKNARVGEEYTLYQIAWLESYNPTSKSFSYKPNSKWSTWLAGNGAQPYVQLTDGYLTWRSDVGTTGGPVADFAKAALANAKSTGSGITALLTITPEAVNTGDTIASIKFTDLRYGYYLVDTTEGLLCNLNSVVGDVTASPKQSVPSLQKVVQEGETYQANNHASIGDEVKYRSRLTITEGVEQLTYHDILSEGLTLKAETIKVYKVLSGNTPQYIDATKDGVQYYTITTGGTREGETTVCSFHVDFTEAFIATYCTASENRINISYSATLNENAHIGKTDPNTNEAYLEYGEKNTTTPHVHTDTYSFGFPIYKYTAATTANPDGTPLQGAKFKIYTSETEIVEAADITYLKFTKATKNGKTVYRLSATGNEEVESGADGYVYIEGLDAGTYYINETSAPAGYRLMPGYVRVTIAQALNGDMVGTFTVGKASDPSEKVGILNNSGNVLPDTGGIGTTIFYVVGSILLVGATILLIVKKRMNDEK